MPILRQLAGCDARFGAPILGAPGAVIPRRRSAFGALMAGCVRSVWLRRFARLTAVSLVLMLALATGLTYHIYFDRRDLPDLASFLRFEPPGIGQIYDDKGKVLIELAREYRRVVPYDEIPVILRDAILAAEDKNFFSHSGLEYRSLPRVLEKTARHSVAAWWTGKGARPRFPDGGSTLTQQLTRSYFLQSMTIRENGDILISDALLPRVLSAGFGVRATNKLLRKMEEARVALWLEQEMQRRYGSRAKAKQEIFARYASFIYLGNGRYGFAAASEYYFGKPLSSYSPEDGDKAALLAGITKSPGVYAPVSGDARPLRRRNTILALMFRNGKISESLMKRCQAEPVRMEPRSLIKTGAAPRGQARPGNAS